MVTKITHTCPQNQKKKLIVRFPLNIKLKFWKLLNACNELQLHFCTYKLSFLNYRFDSCSLCTRFYNYVQNN